MDGLFKRLLYIYIGTADYPADYKFYREVLGARRVWEFENFGAKVAAFDLCGLPYLLIADHVEAPGNRLIYEVENLTASSKELTKRGSKAEGEKFEVPDGPCLNFSDPSGNKYAILQPTRPFILEKEFRSKD